MVEDRCESPDFSYKSRPRFSHAIIRGLSIAVILLGISCIGLGITILSVVLAKKCMVDFEYWRRRYDEPPVTIPDICQYQMTLLSPGLWSGLEFVGSGVIGLLAARKKSSSLIICMMVLSVVTIFISATGCTLAIAGNFDYFYMYNPYPISLHVLDSVLAFLCGVVFIISWVKFSLACYALCCCHQLHASQNAQESTQYQRLMTDNSQATGISDVRKIVSEDSEASSSSRMNRNQIAEDLPGPTSTSLHTRLLPPETA